MTPIPATRISPDRQEARPSRLRRLIFMEVLDERSLLDVGFTATGLADGTHRTAFVSQAVQARTACARAQRVSRLTWMHVTRDAFFAAMAETDQDKLRTRLVWLAAVTLAWIEAIDRRKAARGS